MHKAAVVHVDKDVGVVSIFDLQNVAYQAICSQRIRQVANGLLVLVLAAIILWV